MLDNNPPPVNLETVDHGGRGPNRSTAARVAIPMASTASPTAEPDGRGGSDAGDNTNAHWVKNTAITGALDRNRRSHPRTVVAGNPNRNPIRRWPSPPPPAPRTEPITAPSSRRRTNRSSANNTWVRPQPPQRARRGHTRRSPSTPRTFRQRAWAHRASRSPQPGHRSNPAAKSLSTRSGSTLTMSTDASGITQEGPPRPTAKKSEGVLARTDIPTLAHPHHRHQPAPAKSRPHPRWPNPTPARSATKASNTTLMGARAVSSLSRAGRPSTWR